MDVKEVRRKERCYHPSLDCAVCLDMLIVHCLFGFDCHLISASQLVLLVLLFSTPMCCTLLFYACMYVCI